VVGDGEWTGEYRAGLSVFALAVGKEQGVGGAVAVAELAGLSYKAAGQQCPILDGRAAGYNKVLCHNAAAYQDGCLFVTVDAAVMEPFGTYDPGAGSDPYVSYDTAVADCDVVSYGADIGRMLLGVVMGYFLEFAVQFRTVAVQGHDIGHMGTELVRHRNFPASCLVKYRNLDSVAEGTALVDAKEVDVVYQAVVPDIVVRYELPYLADYAAVADGDIMQGRIAYSAVQTDTSWNNP